MRIAGLIFDFRADIYRVDPVQMQAAVAAPAGGFNNIFGEPRLERAVGAVAPKPIRRELAAIRIPCQVEPRTWEALRMFPAGASNGRDVLLTMHFDDLKRLGLVDATTGEPTLRMGDRLGGIYNRAGGLVCTVAATPGLYINSLHEESFGMSLRAPKRQLLIVSFSDRQQSVETR